MYQQLKKELAEKDVTLVAVSKTKPNSAIEQLYAEGQRIFGENRVQELVEKYESLPKDIQWHCIGHLQKNKVKYIAPFVSLIHSVDSAKLLAVINKEAIKNERKISVLLQFHIATETSKFGLNLEEAKSFLNDIQDYPNIQFHGVMGMATFTDNQEQVAKEFQTLQSIFSTIKSEYFSNNSEFKEISMGMSGDYQLAIENGSTMVRIGSLLFGTRN